MTNNKVAVGGFSTDAMETAQALALEEASGGIDFAYAERLKKRKQGCEGLDDDCDEDEDDDEYQEIIDQMIYEGYTDAEAVRLLNIFSDQSLQTAIKK